MRNVLLIIFFVLLIFPTYGQSIVQNDARQLRKSLLQYHISPRNIDDEYSKDVFELFIDRLDPDQLYFTLSEVSTLEYYRNKIDDELNGSAWTFFPLVLEVYKKSLLRAEKFLLDATEKPLDISKLNPNPIDTGWATEPIELARRWNDVARNEILADLAESATNRVISEAQHLKQHESLSRSKVRVKYQRAIKKMLGHASGFESVVASFFLQSVSFAFDPHSRYFHPTEMQNFISALSTEGFYLGLDVEENDNGDFAITRLLPGGPAWRSGEISNGDVVEKFRWEGKEWVDLGGMDDDEIAEVLTESNTDNIEIVVQKSSGLKKNVTLRKEKIRSEEDAVRSFVMHGNKKVGFISLPDFYSNWGEKEGARSANDVAKELVKLKKENVDGVILDLRDNGGGSLAEAVALAGIFVDAGPIGVYKSKTGEPITMKDINRGTVYDGPLIIMVNGQSASASEFLASALQDYNRAVIVGGQTFGKAIAQEIFSLEPGKTVVDYENLSGGSKWGFSTITTGRIYRINGKSIQKNGVLPDIMLPDFFSITDFSERATPFALDPDSIVKKTYPQLLSPLPLRELNRLSAQRRENDAKLKGLENYIKVMRHEISADQNEVATWQSLNKRVGEIKQTALEMQKLLAVKATAYQIMPTQFSTQRLQLDDYSDEVSKTWINNLMLDPQLEEAYFIMNDFIDLKTK